MSHLLFILICLFWGCSFLLMKKAALCFGDLDIALYRVIAGAGALWLIWKVRKQPWPFHKRDLLPLLAVAVFGYALPFWIQPFTIRETTSGFVSIFVALVPLLTIIVSIPLLHVLPTKRQILGVLGGFACLILLFHDQLKQHVPLWVLLLGAVTPLVYAIANTYIKRRFQHVPPSPLTAGAMALAAIALLPIAVTTEPVQFNDSFPLALGSVLILGVISTGVATAFFYTLIRDHGPLYASMVTYVIPCVSLLLGWFDGETVTTMQILSLVGIFAMVAMVQYQPRRQVVVGNEQV